jgi:DNA/RNA endonuclease G (NUC1)
VSRKGFTFFTEHRTEARVASKDYNQSGYSRGHMTPFAAIAYSFGDTAPTGEDGVNPARETFSMANIAPQLQKHNAGIWSNLEDAVAGVRTAGGFTPGLTQRAAKIWVYTGPVLASKGPAATISEKEIQVPTAFWKAAIWITPAGETRACAWIIPHDPDLDPATFMAYATTLAEVRKQARVTILPEDPEGLMEHCDKQELEP